VIAGVGAGSNFGAREHLDVARLEIDDEHIAGGDGRCRRPFDVRICL
jgi:hypothetical protein